MPNKPYLAPLRLLLVLTIFSRVCPVFGANVKVLHGHVPEAARHLTPLAKLAFTNELHLAIGVQLHDPAGLEQLIAAVSDPASPNYRHFVNSEELAARFGPTEADYAAVEYFALTNGFKIVRRHDNRLLLDVSGHTPEIERAFHFNLQKYRHPTEAREFFAPDTEPTVDAALPVADVQGLSDFSRPHPRLEKMDPTRIMAKNGSAPDNSGSYFGDDFRNAYAPGTTLTGAGQMVGLLQFDGFYGNDIAAYAHAAGGGRENIVIQTVLLDGYNGVPTTGANSGEGEVSLDIEMAMAMAPGLAKIVVFEAGPSGSQNDLLNSMLSYSTTVKQLSCSWGWSGGPSTTTDNIFKLMAAEGQSFFNASGDSDAFTVGANSANGVDKTSLQNAPSSSPYITQVGGTTLSMDGNGGSFSLETVWNWDVEYGSSYDGQGSSGGVSSYYSIPSWQTNISMAASGGSTTFRNIPDVALTADNIYTVSGGGAQGSGGKAGTSCAAPLWAGFMALVNQQASNLGNAPAGFINPAIYAIGRGINSTYSYSACFHDTTTGNNFWSASPAKYPAVSGFDLCTGWGTPNGTNLINALAGSHDTLGIFPGIGFNAIGPKGGPFNPGSGNFQLTNTSATSFIWSLVSTSAWLAASFANGMLAAHSATNVNISTSAAASNLAVKIYSAIILFTNGSTHIQQTVPFTLQILQPLSVTPVKGFTSVGPVGGPFQPNLQNFIITNLSGGVINWSLIKTSSWLSVTSSNGPLAAGGQTNVTVSVFASANTLAAGIYHSSLAFANPSGLVAVVPFTALVGQPIIQNGGFETGDFAGWTQSGNTASTSVANNTASYVHSGSYGAQLGPANAPGYLSQNLTTTPGQSYLLSLWLRNQAGTTPNSFQVQWNGVTLASLTDLTSTGWTNLQFLVPATTSSSVLQFGFQDDPAYLGLDDIALTTITNPGFKSTVKNTNSFNLTFDATTGLKYQVQYKTNLIQANWLNLGGTITAATNSLLVTDTNVTISAQRFYRLQVTP